MDKMSTNMTVAEYCEAMERGAIRVNRKYQRNDEVWPEVAQSFLIETLLLSFPIPKLYLHSITDPRARTTIKEIVDGQQRSRAIKDYFDDKFSLSKKLDTEQIAGRKYSQLEFEDQQRFVSYQLPMDLFINATDEEVREVFRRMNSYTVPLNPEEQRHASYQGEFKWFAYKIGHDYDQSFVNIGAFKDRQLVRMADTKLITEICHSFLNGIDTTKRKELDEVYAEYDAEFPSQELLDRQIRAAFDRVLASSDIFHTPLMKPFLLYSLVLAFIHCAKPVSTLQGDFRLPKPSLQKPAVYLRNLLHLSTVLSEKPAKSNWSHFLAACASKTNVREQRVIRFQTLCRALSEGSLK